MNKNGCMKAIGVLKILHRLHRKQKEVNEVKGLHFFDVVINSNLTWEAQMGKICIRPDVFIFKALSYITELEVMRTIHYCLMYTFISCGIIVGDIVLNKIMCKESD
jgi:hypothetical protein